MSPQTCIPKHYNVAQVGISLDFSLNFNLYLYFSLYLVLISLVCSEDLAACAHLEEEVPEENLENKTILLLNYVAIP